MTFMGKEKLMRPFFYKSYEDLHVNYLPADTMRYKASFPSKKFHPKTASATKYR